MEIHTLEELLDYIDQDLFWRKKELVTIKLLIDSTSETDEHLQIRLRIGAVILYSHWEGFIKSTSNFYLNYLSHLPLKYDELNDRFITLSLRGEIKNCSESNKVSIHHKIVDKLMNQLTSEATIPFKDIVPPCEILNYALFYEILFTFGINKEYYELKQQLIDRELIRNRNAVAHGRRTSLKKSDFYVLYNHLMPMLEEFKSQIIDSAQNERYKKERGFIEIV
jgi:hypothetical protein